MNHQSNVSPPTTQWTTSIYPRNKAKVDYVIVIILQNLWNVAIILSYDQDRQKLQMSNSTGIRKGHTRQQWFFL